MTGAAIVPEIMTQLSAMMAEYLGLQFPRSRWRDLAKGLQAAAGELGLGDAEVLAEQLLSGPVTKDVLEVVASHITIGETYFFREKGVFEVLEQQILPKLLTGRSSGEKRLRIWSAGCASGEEAYSLAILLHRMLPDLQDWQILLLATDISQKALKKAGEGVYTQWSFRDAPAWLTEKYFNRASGNRWELKPWIKNLVTFSSLNLAVDPFPSFSNQTAELDIIFCRNVLMYFTPQVVERVVQNFSASLVEGGWLAVSPAECALLKGADLVACARQGAILFQKTGSQKQACSAGSGVVPLNQETGRILHESLPRPLNSDRAETHRRGRSSSHPCTLSGSVGPEAGPQTPGCIAGDTRPFFRTPEEQDRHSKARRQTRPTPGNGTDRAATATPSPISPLPGVKDEAAVLRQHLGAAENGDAEAMSWLARLLANQGRLEEARIWGEKAIAGDQLNPKHYYLLASILQELSRQEEATSLLKKTLYLQSDFVLAHFSLGNLAVQQQRPAEAAKYFSNVLKLLKDSPNEAVIPASEGLTTGALREVVKNITLRLKTQEKL